MSALEIKFSELEAPHREALEWFNSRRGEDIRWPAPLNGVHLVNPQTGIQKPKGWIYALSIRETLNSPYDDHDPVAAPDGSWTYRYFQERADPE
ncbi:MAG: hypothetical protein V7672_10495 [Brevundimonas sp.]|uniref:hypothetical protein n=1 Tax=Brevundimonas sp. TaxID=1871086 RepID=UPI00300123A6